MTLPGISMRLREESFVFRSLLFTPKIRNRLAVGIFLCLIHIHGVDKVISNFQLEEVVRLTKK